MASVDRLAARFYPQLGDNWDDAFFREAILQHLQPGSTILDLGVGRGIVSQMNFSDHARVCGLDPNESVLQNPYLHQAKVGSGEEIPWPDNTFDLVFSDNVLEHLPRPLKVFQEVRRVLKPGGVFLAKTPNRYHYVPLVASLTPYWFHLWFKGKGREERDVFPTLYRANTRGRLRSLARQSGLEVAELKTIEGRPEYLTFHPAAYLLGVAYERLLNSSELFCGLRVVLIAVFRNAH